MKKILFLLAIVVSFAACKNTTNNKKEAETAMSVENLMLVADQNVDNTITVQGVVVHICKHGGQKCFIEDENGDLTLRVNATGDISSFSEELNGKVIAVTGVLKEIRTSSQELEDEAKELALKAEDPEENAHDCQTEINNIETMRAWMKENNKDYYPTYYIDGTSYKVVEQE